MTTESDQKPPASSAPVTQTKGRWVPVTDCKPNIGQDIIVADEYGEVWRSTYFADGFFTCPTCQQEGDDVAHWMPLPQAPRSSDEGTEERSA